jgi:site-specific recombinase XerD
MSGHATMINRAQEYLAHRRALGFALDSSGTLLLRFARFADRSNHRGPLTADMALRWASLPQTASPRYRAERLSIVRGFARYLAAEDGRSQVPDHRLLGQNHYRLQPHIYSDRQLRELVLAAAKLPPVDRLRPYTYSTLFGLLASTGLRVSEALNLNRERVDLDRGILRIEETKFRKSRLVPLHPTATRALRRYVRERDRERLARDSDAFFVGGHGQTLPYSTVRGTFRRLCAQLRWRSNGMLPRPRIHDLRHSFACRRLLRWYQQGINVDHAIASLSTYLGHVKVTDTYWYLTGTAPLLATAGQRFERFARPAPGGDHEHVKPSLPHHLLGPALQRYFCQYLIGQRNLSPQTISAYRDSFKLLIRFLEHQYRQKVDELSVTDLDASRILAFLDDLERRRGNSPRSRNARLAAIRSFIRYTASAEPLLLPVAQRLLAIPMKRFEHGDARYLRREQMQALLEAPDPLTRTGLRDRVLLMLMYNTGARVSEITALRIGDLHLQAGGSVHIHGKGRKQRSVPLWRQTVRLLRQWLKRTDGTPEKPVVPNGRGGLMTRAGVTQRLRQAVARAAIRDSSLQKRRISPHTIRHTTAMHLLQSGVDLSVIAMWLGHESIQTNSSIPAC